MRVKLLAPHVVADAVHPRGAILEWPASAMVTPLMEGLNDEARAAIEYQKLKVWGRYSWPHGLFPPSGTPLDDPPITRPLDDNQPEYHYVGRPEYL